jgi:hypothetical protein
VRLTVFAFAILGALISACAEGEPLVSPTGGQGGDGSGGGASSSDASSSSGGVCAEDPCKLVSPQCGCEAGEACSVDGSGQRACLPAGTAALGQACDASTGCAAGAACIGYGPTLNSCSAFCDTDADCEPPGGLCTISVGAIPGVTFCSANCDLVSSTGCELAGLSCQFGVRDATDPFTLCAPSGNGVQDTPCTETSECAPGFLCLQTQVDERCFKWCDVALQDCLGGLTCQAVEIAAGVPLVIGNITYGACN